MVDETSDARRNARGGGEPPLEGGAARSSPDASDIGQRYRTLVEQAPIGVFLYDRALRLTDCNPRFVAILRSSRERLIGLDLKTLRYRPIVAPIQRALEAGESTAYEGPYEATTSSASIVISMRVAPVRDARGVVVGGIGLVEDVTDRVRAEAELKVAVGALRRSEARFRLLIEAAPDAIAVVRRGRIVYANAALAELLGYDDARALVGRPSLAQVHADDRRELDARSRALLGHDAARAGARGAGEGDDDLRAPREYRLLRRDGSVVAAEIVPIPTDYDGAPAIIGFARDVTERKRMQARLLQADRMASVGTLAAGVAHEINNPLAYLFANLDLVAQRRLPEIAREIADERDIPDATRARLLRLVREAAEMVDVARDGAGRVRHIVRDLKTFSRGDDDRAEIVDVRRVLDASVNMASNEIRHRAALLREYGEVPAVSASESRLGQVFLNLLVNAAQALPVDRADDNAVVARTRTDVDGWAVVEIRDTGEGIPADVLGRIFDPFFTTKPVGVGTGLGLWICEGIVTGLGGEIAVESEVGVGTTFRVRLPPFDRAPTRRPLPGAAAPRDGHTTARG